jgi:hypothetical protein
VLVAGWALANVLAIAYARGAEQSIGVSARYADVLALGIFASLAAGWALVPGARRPRPIAAALAAVSLAFIAGLAARGYAARTVLDHRVASDVQNRAVVAAHVRGAPLVAAPGGFPVYPDLAALERFLAEPAIRASLPYSVAEPLRLDPATRAWTSPDARLALHVRDRTLERVGTARFASGSTDLALAAGPGDGQLAYFDNLGGPFRIEIADPKSIGAIANGPVRIGPMSIAVRAAHPAAAIVALLGALAAAALLVRDAWRGRSLSVARTPARPAHPPSGAPTGSA